MNMDHAEAVTRSLTEKYLLGELDEEVRLSYEEHFFGCAECAEDVRAAAALIDGARLVLEKHPDGRASGERARGLVRLFWPMPLGAAAALALCATFAGYEALVATPSLRRQLRDADGLQAAPSYFLSVSRAEPTVLTIPRSYQKVVLRLSRSSERAYPAYRCEVQDASGRVRLSAVVPAAPDDDELQVVLPVRGLSPGRHVVVLGGLDSPPGSLVARDLARYEFTLRFAGE
jgi:hypothetical protein